MFADGDAAAVEDRHVVRARSPSPGASSVAADGVGHRRRVARRCAFRPVPIAQTGS